MPIGVVGAAVRSRRSGSTDRALCRNGDDEKWSEQWLAHAIASHFFYAQWD